MRRDLRSGRWWSAVKSFGVVSRRKGTSPRRSSSGATARNAWTRAPCSRTGGRVRSPWAALRSQRPSRRSCSPRPCSSRTSTRRGRFSPRTTPRSSRSSDAKSKALYKRRGTPPHRAWRSPCSRRSSPRRRRRARSCSRQATRFSWRPRRGTASGALGALPTRRRGCRPMSWQGGSPPETCSGPSS